MNILLVSPHADDAEIACGGTTSKLRTPHNTLWSLYFAPCKEDSKNTNHLKQHHKAIEILGIDKLIEHSFAKWSLENRKQEIRNILWQINKTFQPDVVFCPTPNDLHQDHKPVADCCLTIFRNSMLLGYECLASCPNFTPNWFVNLSKADVDRKMQAIKCYKSQLKARSSYFNLDKLLALMEAHGAQIRTTWAEAYEFLWCGSLW